MLLIQGLIVKTGCWRTLLLSPAIKVTGHHVQAALGAWWKMEDVLSEASFCLPDLVWRVSLSVVVWPYLEDDPVQNFLQALHDSAQKSCSFSAYLITRYCVMTKHPFPPVTLRAFIYPTPRTINELSLWSRLLVLLCCPVGQWLKTPRKRQTHFPLSVVFHGCLSFAHSYKDNSVRSWECYADDIIQSTFLKGSNIERWSFYPYNISQKILHFHTWTLGGGVLKP